MKKPSFRQRHPLFGKTVTGIVLAYAVPLFIITLSNLPFSDLTVTAGELGGTVVNIAASVASFLALLIHRFWFREEFSGCFNRSGLGDRKVNLIILAAFCAIVLATVVPNWFICGITVPSAYMLTAAIVAGVGEETIFRAFPVSVIMRGARDKKRVIFALIFTSLLFGLTHLSNLKAGASVQGTIVQIISASFSGILLCAIYLRTGNILYGMLFHCLYDYACFMQTNMATGVVGDLSASDIGLECVGIAINIVAALLLLRGHMNDVLGLWSGIWKLPETEPADAGNAM